MNGIKDAMQIGVRNQDKIAAVEKELLKMISDLSAEFTQFKVRSDLEITQSVRQEMYEQIKQNNIGVTKRITEL